MESKEHLEEMKGDVFAWAKKYFLPEEAAETSGDPLRDIREHLERMKTMAKDAKDYYAGPPVIIIGGGGVGKNIAIATHMAAAGFHTCGPHEVQAGNLEYAMERFEKLTGHRLTEQELIPFKGIAEYTNDSLADILNGLNSSIEKARSCFDVPKLDISDFKDLGIAEACSSTGYNENKKVEHFQNKTLGAKIGGRKHKKNPFNFRR